MKQLRVYIKWKYLRWRSNINKKAYRKRKLKIDEKLIKNVLIKEGAVTTDSMGAGTLNPTQGIPPQTMSPKKKRRKDRKSTRLNSSHIPLSRMPSSA